MKIETKKTWRRLSLIVHIDFTLDTIHLLNQCDTIFNNIDLVYQSSSPILSSLRRRYTSVMNGHGDGMQLVLLENDLRQMHDTNKGLPPFVPSSPLMTSMWFISKLRRCTVRDKHVMAMDKQRLIEHLINRLGDITFMECRKLRQSLG
jgi:hypothetical protein